AASRRLVELEAMFEAGDTDLSRSQIDAFRKQVESGADRAVSISSGVGGLGGN
ncbi:hypothetical protein IIC65_09010, partial [Candidatus Sumerlaeota bacterium]|nr:hypothetical protein [Candidatus Sumerlaeota bacterium]